MGAALVPTLLRFVVNFLQLAASFLLLRLVPARLFSRPYLGLARASVSFARFLIGKENLCCGYKHQRPRLALLLAPVFSGWLDRRCRPYRPLRFLLAVDHPPRSRARRHRPAAPSWCRTRRRGAAPRRRGWPFSGCSWQRRGTHHRAARDRRNSPRRAPRAWFGACSSTCARISGKKVRIVSLGANDPETACGVIDNAGGTHLATTRIVAAQ